MAADNSFVSYRGDAGLGLGSTSAIPVTSDKGLDQVNDLGRSLLQMDAARNLNIFNQKLRDQDKLYELLDQDKIDPGPILAEDRKMVDEANNAVTKSWGNVNENGGVRNINAMRGYKETVQNAKNVSTQARARYLQSLAQEKEIADSKLDSEREARTNHLNKWKPNFWGNITPFQPTNSYDLAATRNYFVNGSMRGEDGQPVGNVTVKTQSGPNGTTVTQTATGANAVGVKGARPQSAPVLKEFEYVPGSRLSYSDMVQKAEAAFGGDPAMSQNIEKIYDQLGSHLNPTEFVDLIGRMNKKLIDYNQTWGLDTNDKDYVAPITQADIVIDPQTGERHFNTSKPTLAAKVVLAMENNTGQKGGFVFNKDQADLKENKRKNKENEAIDWAKIGIDKKKADLDVQKFMESTQGTTKLKNASLVYAANTLKTLQDAASLKTKEADGSVSQWVLTPKDIRKLTQRELEALGRSISTTEKKEDGTTSTTTKTKIDPLSIDETSVLVVGNDGTVRVLTKAYNPETKKYDHTESGHIRGEFDENKGTNIQQIALNNYRSIIESGQGQEINGFAGIIDPKGTGTQVDEQGGGTKSSGTNVSKSNTATGEKIYAKAKPVDANVDVSTLADGSYQLPNGKVAKVKRGKVISIQ